MLHLNIQRPHFGCFLSHALMPSSYHLQLVYQGKSLARLLGWGNFSSGIQNSFLRRSPDPQCWKESFLTISLLAIHEIPFPDSSKLTYWQQILKWESPVLYVCHCTNIATQCPGGYKMPLLDILSTTHQPGICFWTLELCMSINFSQSSAVGKSVLNRQY